MKVLITLSLASTVLVVANLLILVTSTPVPMSTPATEEATKNSNCEIRFDPEPANKFAASFWKCSNETGFPGNFTFENVTFVEMMESSNLDDKCFSKCFFEDLKIFNSKGKLEKDNFASIFKTNAPEKMEKERIKEWKTCAKKFENDMKEKKKPGSKVDRSCLHAAEFFVCGMKSEEKLIAKCQRKHNKP